MGRGYKKASAVGGAAAAPTPRGLGPPQPALGVPRWAQRCGAAGNACCFGGVPPAGPPVHLPGAGGGVVEAGGGRQRGVISTLSPTAAPERRYLRAPTAPRPGIARREGPKERNETGGGPTSRPRHRGRHKGGCVRGAANKAALSWDRGGNAGIWGGGGWGGLEGRCGRRWVPGGSEPTEPQQNTPWIRCCRGPRVPPTSRPPRTAPAAHGRSPSRCAPRTFAAPRPAPPPRSALGVFLLGLKNNTRVLPVLPGTASRLPVPPMRRRGGPGRASVAASSRPVPGAARNIRGAAGAAGAAQGGGRRGGSAEEGVRGDPMGFTGSGPPSAPGAGFFRGRGVENGARGPGTSAGPSVRPGTQRRRAPPIPGAPSAAGNPELCRYPHRSRRPALPVPRTPTRSRCSSHSRCSSRSRCGAHLPDRSRARGCGAAIGEPHRATRGAGTGTGASSAPLRAAPGGCGVPGRGGGNAPGAGPPGRDGLGWAGWGGAGAAPEPRDGGNRGPRTAPGPPPRRDRVLPQPPHRVGQSGSRSSTLRGGGFRLLPPPVLS